MTGMQTGSNPTTSSSTPFMAVDVTTPDNTVDDVANKFIFMSS
jgi:hypothetical protein